MDALDRLIADAAACQTCGRPHRADAYAGHAYRAKRIDVEWLRDWQRRATADLPKPSDLMTPGEVAEALGIGLVAVYDRGTKGKLSFIRTPTGKRRYLRPEIERLLGNGEGVVSPGYAGSERRLVPAEVSR